MSALSLGDRIGQIRRRRGMTQEEVAERAGISKAVIVKLEQNRRDGARIDTLNAIARGLGVKTSELLGDGVELDPADNGHTAQLLQLRRVLTPSLTDTGEDQPGLNVADLRASVVELTRAYHESHFKRALGMLPDFLRDAERTAAAQTGDHATLTHRLLAHAYITTANTLLGVRHKDLAYEAVRRAMVYAEKVGDEVLYAMAGEGLCWILEHQARFDEAQETAIQLAASIEPAYSSNDLVQTSVWGRLQLRVACVAGRNNQLAQAREALLLAQGAAARVGTDHLNFDTYHSRFGPTLVAVINTSCAMTAGEPDRALQLGRSINVGGAGWRTTYNRHFLTMADAYFSTRQYSQSVQSLMTAKDITPEYVTEHRLARHTVRQLLDVLPVRTSKGAGLAELAAEMGIRP